MILPPPQAILYFLCCGSHDPDPALADVTGVNPQLVSDSSDDLLNHSVSVGCRKYQLNVTADTEHNLRVNGQTFCICQNDDCLPWAERSTGKKHNFRMFMFLAIIPLTFGIIAVAMALFCRNPCFNNCLSVLTKVYRRCTCHTAAPESEMSDEAFRNYAREAHQRCIEYEQNKLTRTAEPTRSGTRSSEGHRRPQTTRPEERDNDQNGSVREESRENSGNARARSVGNPTVDDQHNVTIPGHRDAPPPYSPSGGREPSAPPPYEECVTSNPSL